MNKDVLWKQSNIYAMHGIDFMIDENMNLWFIESNPTPHLGGTTKEKNKIYYDLLTNLFHTQYAYYQSRMKRVFRVIKDLQQEAKTTDQINLAKWQKEYDKAIKNRLEPEYQLKPENTFQLVFDENLPNSDAYFNLIPHDCL